MTDYHDKLESIIESKGHEVVRTYTKEDDDDMVWAEIVTNEGNEKNIGVSTTGDFEHNVEILINHFTKQ